MHIPPRAQPPIDSPSTAPPTRRTKAKPSPTPRDDHDSALFDAAALPAAVISAAGRVQKTSASLRELLGLDPSELHATSWVDLTHPNGGNFRSWRPATGKS